MKYLAEIRNNKLKKFELGGLGLTNTPTFKTNTPNLLDSNGINFGNQKSIKINKFGQNGGFGDAMKGSPNDLGDTANSVPVVDPITGTIKALGIIDTVSTSMAKNSDGTFKSKTAEGLYNTLNPLSKPKDLLEGFTTGNYEAMKRNASFGLWGGESYAEAQVRKAKEEQTKQESTASINTAKLAGQQQEMTGGFAGNSTATMFKKGGVIKFPYGGKNDYEGNRLETSIDRNFGMKNNQSIVPSAMLRTGLPLGESKFDIYNKLHLNPVGQGLEFGVGKQTDTYNDIDYSGEVGINFPKFGDAMVGIPSPTEFKSKLGLDVVTADENKFGVYGEYNKIINMPKNANDYLLDKSRGVLGVRAERGGNYNYIRGNIGYDLINQRPDWSVGVGTKFAEGGKLKKPVFLGKLDNRVVSDNTSVQKPTIQQQDVRLKTPQEVKKTNRENFQKHIGVKPTYNVQELIDFGTPEPGLEDASLEALDALSLASGVGYLGKKGLQVGANYLGNKYLPNAYKLNPKAFKPNPEAYYRGVGKEGIEDALKSGVIKSRDQDLFPSPYFARPNEFETALYYNPKALIEAKGIDVSKVNKIEPNQIIFKNKDAGVIPLNPNWVDEVYLGNNTPGFKFSQLKGIPIDNPNIKLLQKDWLRGYKPITFKEGGVIKDNKRKFADGGNVANPQYEVEKDEVVQGQDTNLEEQTDLASDMTLAGGETHENGGTLGEGGERVFSNRLLIGKPLYGFLSANKIPVKLTNTYAEVATKLGKLKGKYEPNTTSKDPLKHKTATTMTTRIDGLIEAAFQEQEINKQNDMATKTFAYGGKLKKLFAGGVNPTDNVKPKKTLKNPPLFGTDGYNEWNTNDPNDIVDLERKKVNPTSKLDWEKALEYPTVFGGESLTNPTTPVKSDVVKKNDKLKNKTNYDLDGLDSHLMNAAIYLKTLNLIDSQEKGIKRKTATPLLQRNVNFLSSANNEIDKTVDTANKTMARNTSSYQDQYSRNADLVSRGIEGKNKAAQAQAAMDMQTANTNNNIINDYNNRNAENINADAIDRVINKNAIIASKTNALNTFLQGVMGHEAIKRKQNVDKEKLAISRMYAGNRGTNEYINSKIKDAYKKGEITKEAVEELTGEEFKRGGVLPRKMKSYC